MATEPNYRDTPWPCAECERHFADNLPALLHAASSVGIERELGTFETLSAYFRDYHRTGHKPRPEGAS